MARELSEFYLFATQISSWMCIVDSVIQRSSLNTFVIASIHLFNRWYLHARSDLAFLTLLPQSDNPSIDCCHTKSTWSERDSPAINLLSAESTINQPRGMREEIGGCCGGRVRGRRRVLSADVGSSFPLPTRDFRDKTQFSDHERRINFNLFSLFFRSGREESEADRQSFPLIERC